MDLHVFWQVWLITHFPLLIILSFSEEELVDFSEQYGWEVNEDTVFLVNQEAIIKSKNIQEKLGFDGKSLKEYL